MDTKTKSQMSAVPKLDEQELDKCVETARGLLSLLEKENRATEFLTWHELVREYIHVLTKALCNDK